ncbi:MAG: RsmB/NOP family class I SAM-dependent RNA methyltransferase [Eubacteriales bacterium]|nr:RsmB/NOP family class I SAM-dependent RNA methyltransferase [Eubacteriales bacterium]
MKLPETFLSNMRDLLGADYELWLASFQEPPCQGLRINTRKISVPEWERVSPFGSARVPWTPNGYYVGDKDRPSKDPYYFAGLYYIQEPSAMAPAAILPVRPGDRVLDLCAAPGGKSTQLGAALDGRGILISNDISNSRAKALLKNLEMAGIPNFCVTSETPEKLASVFGSFFDRILVDAPCSGEGMFRRDPDLIKSWEEHGPEYYVPVQREILRHAAAMLRPDGYLLYSTCTFSPSEDEENIDWLLDEQPDMELVPIPLWEGACPGIDGKPVIRLFPHRLRGEGHFAALLRKKGQAGQKPDRLPGKAGLAPAERRRLEKESDYLQWESMCREPFPRDRMMIRDSQLYLLPEEFDKGWRLRYLRTGLLLGEWKKDRFEPSQAAAMALGPADYRQTLSLDKKDGRVLRYLKGETISLEEAEQPKEKGWVLLCVDGYGLGWAKYAGGSLKNKYYPGWRWQ